LRSVVADRPKVLADIHGRPFLAYLLDYVAAAGIRSAVLCTGYMAAQVQAAFGSDYGQLALRYSQESSPLGTGGALRLVLPWLETDSVLVMNGDSFCDADLAAFWAWHCGRHADASVLLIEAADTRRYGAVRVDAEGRVLGFAEKSQVTGSGWINAGIYLLRRQLLSTIPPHTPVSLERQMFPAWLRRRFYGYRSTARFLDIGTPASYALAHQFFTPTPQP
jgi:NDP-sugar pyrophosphorylase family protein